MRDNLIPPAVYSELTVCLDHFVCLTVPSEPTAERCYLTIPAHFKTHKLGRSHTTFYCSGTVSSYYWMVLHDRSCAFSDGPTYPSSVALSRTVGLIGQIIITHSKTVWANHLASEQSNPTIFPHFRTVSPNHYSRFRTVLPDHLPLFQNSPTQPLPLTSERFHSTIPEPSQRSESTIFPWLKQVLPDHHPLFQNGPTQPSSLVLMVAPDHLLSSQNGSTQPSSLIGTVLPDHIPSA